MTELEPVTAASLFKQMFSKLKGLLALAGSAAAVVAAIAAAYHLHVPVEEITQAFIRIGATLIVLTVAWDALDRLGTRIVQTGKTPWPVSFWRVATGKLGHVPGVLSEKSVMLLVPSGREEEAQELIDKLGETRLRFH